MAEQIEAELREGTDRVVTVFTARPAAELRAHADRRVRRRRAATAALSLVAVAVAGTVAFGVDGHGAEGHNPSAASQPSSRAHTSVPAAAAGPAVTVNLDTPAVYAQGTGSKVRLTIANPGAARRVILSFTVASLTQSGWWVLPCDTGADACSAADNYSSGPLTMDSVVNLRGANPLQVVRYSLTLPSGTSSYTLWVTPPAGAHDFSVAVLDGKTDLGDAVSAPIVASFLTVAEVDQTSTTLTRHSTLEFSTRVSNPNPEAYLGMTELLSVACRAGQSAEVPLPIGTYTLGWWDPSELVNIVSPDGILPQVNFDLKANASVVELFVLGLLPSAPANLTSCQATITVSGDTDGVAPYFDHSQPYVQTVVNFQVQ